MKILATLTDPQYTRPATFTAYEQFLLKLIKDERDLPFIKLCVRITVTMLPVAVLLYMPFVQGWLFAALVIVYHYFNNVAYKGPFGLMVHCTSHRVLFKREYDWLNKYIPWVLAPFFGHSPETYYTHHVGMHHPENNMPQDDSSTMAYQRDSKKDFAKYLGRFLVVGIYNLCTYLFSKKRNKLMQRSLRGELFFYALCIALSFVNFQATLWVFLVPFLLYRLVAMMGNWAQHAFVDATDPDNGFKNSITCINTPYNHKCWNDGYHISHHVKPTIHYTEHPALFLNTQEQYINNNSIVFDGIHFLHIYFWLMQKRYDLLAKHFVNLGNRFSSDEEVVAFLKSRTARIDVSNYEVPQKYLWSPTKIASLK